MLLFSNHGLSLFSVALHLNARGFNRVALIKDADVHPLILI